MTARRRERRDVPFAAMNELNDECSELLGLCDVSPGAITPGL